VDEVVASDWSELAGSEEAGEWGVAEALPDDRGVMADAAEELLASAIARDEE